jgi:membrane protein YdbS with pleckstrin-like domain
VTWQRVSPRLAVARRLLLGLAVAVVVAVDIAFWLLLGSAWVLVLVPVVLVGLAWGWWLIGRQTRAIGYAERDDDLLVRRGILIRDLVVVPYGRMQYVDVHAGPLEQAYKIATVHLHTASPGTSARIPGLPADEAARLRDRLTALGEAQAAGL